VSEQCICVSRVSELSAYLEKYVKLELLVIAPSTIGSMITLVSDNCLIPKPLEKYIKFQTLFYISSTGHHKKKRLIPMKFFGCAGMTVVGTKIQTSDLPREEWTPSALEYCSGM